MGIKNSQMGEQVIREARKQTGALFRKRRMELGLSQTEVAEFCGVRYQTIERIEAGMFAFSIDHAFMISSCLGMTISFKEKEE